MHRFVYREAQLYCEDVTVKKIVAKYGSPIYIYSKNTFLDHYVKLKTAFREVKPLICYSVKANSNLSVLKVLKEAGSGFDVVSSGEIYRVQKIGANPKKVVYASVGKQKQDIAFALNWGILMFNVESLAELSLIDQTAGELNKKAKVALRINPNVDAKTHKYITTAKKENKFGIDLSTAQYILGNQRQFRNVDIVGIHIHIGSQILDISSYVEALKKVYEFVQGIKARGKTKLKFLNIGGGLGIQYNDERPNTAQEFAKKVLPYIKKIGLRLIMEPGRFIAGNSGIFVCRVIYVKEGIDRRFAIVDGAMNDLIRPSLYGAYHHIWPVEELPERKQFRYDVVGPICESGDFFAKQRLLPELKSGDLLSIFSAGAYGFVMASNYNSRPKPAEVMVDGDKFYLIRKRETFQDLIRLERIR